MAISMAESHIPMGTLMTTLVDPLGTMRLTSLVSCQPPELFSLIGRTDIPFTKPVSPPFTKSVKIINNAAD